ncbi:DUF2913 family protein [Shewanella maritima]|uniref:DUF2913 family protein n=1 Tax=Shewanella maritima TaxID=2520507 RepID=A0A411PGD0_9GAMM|nr:DUF2913 family protein [Shewanella maritima]QBF82621.1 DUF2913 family protein [Shewanella maritima]
MDLAKDKTHRQCLNQFCTNALLHLYITSTEKTQPISPIERNRLLKRFIKPKLENHQFRLIKRELKTILQSKRSIEHLLLKAIEVTSMQDKMLAEIVKWTNFISELSSTLALDIEVIKEEHPLKRNAINVLDNDVFNSFDVDTGTYKQLLTIKICYTCQKLTDKIIALVQQDKLYQVASLQTFEGEGFFVTTAMLNFKTQCVQCPDFAANSRIKSE